MNTKTRGFQIFTRLALCAGLAITLALVASGCASSGCSACGAKSKSACACKKPLACAKCGKVGCTTCTP